MIQGKILIILQIIVPLYIAEIQAFLLPVENSLNCIFAVACDCFTVENHTKSHENHTKLLVVQSYERTSSREGAGLFMINRVLLLSEDE